MRLIAAMITASRSVEEGLAPRVVCETEASPAASDLVRFRDAEDVAQIPKRIQRTDRHFFRANGL